MHGVRTLPTEVEQVFQHFLTCEFSTLARDGTPITWPMVAVYRPQEGDFLLTTSIGFVRKASNLRRDMRVSMLFSEATGSSLNNPSAVLVQGQASVSDEVAVLDEIDGLREYWRATLGRLSSSVQVSDIPFIRDWMDWYYMRLLITVRPTRMLWWPGRDFGAVPREVML